MIADRSTSATLLYPIVGQPTIKAASTKPGVLHAGILLPGSGTWELFLQFKSNGKIVTVPYTLKVR